MPSSRLDELFSPERLRRSWQAPPAPAAELPPGGRNRAIHEQHRELLRLLDERFFDTGPLAVPLAELARRLNCDFPPDAADNGDAAAGESIVALLEQLEELIRALELAQPGAGR